MVKRKYLYDDLKIADRERELARHTVQLLEQHADIRERGGNSYVLQVWELPDGRIGVQGHTIFENGKEQRFTRTIRADAATAIKSAGMELVRRPGTPAAAAIAPESKNLALVPAGSETGKFPASLAKRQGAALSLPQIITREGEKTTRRYLEFFTANIRNANTRSAYARACGDFLDWCDGRGASLEKIEPMIVAAYIEKMGKEREPQTVKQSLAAIRMLFDWLVIGQIVPFNPAASVRGPRYSYKQGKTPVLPVDEMRQFLDLIDTSTVTGLRDRALIGLMVYSFSRVSAVVGMKVKDYYSKGKRHFIGLNEKGGKYHEVPVHHKAEDFLDAYIEAAGIAGEKNAPLFQSAGGKGRKLSGKAMSRFDAWAMVKRRAKEAGISAEISPHSFRATGITAYLENGGSIEHAQQIAAHESPRTTKLYDRTNEAITLDEIERIAI